MIKSIQFKGRSLKAITFEGGGTVYPKGVKNTKIDNTILNYIPSLKNG